MEKRTLATNMKQCKKSKTLVDGHDRISDLPDFLLLHILSFLKMPDVVKTSLLSTRWRYLWTSISCLDFETHDWEGRKTDLVRFIDRSIFYHDGSKVHELYISLHYKDTDAFFVDSWFHFAIRHNVEKFRLGLIEFDIPSADVRWSDTRYILPSLLFKCSSLKYLSLSFCDLRLPTIMQLCALKELVLKYIVLPKDMIRHLTTNCPMLEDLTLYSCNKISDLIIDIANPNLKSLDIFEFYETKADTVIKICAPNLQSLGFHCYLPRARYLIKDALSLVTASISFEPESINLDFVYDEDDCDDHLVELLHDLCHVKQLIICRYFIQVLSIRGVQNFNFLSFNATSLQLETELRKWELPGILYLLKGCSSLDRLEINYPKFREDIMLSDDLKDTFAFEEKKFWESKKCYLAPVLQNLKHISIYFVSGTEQNDNVAAVMEKLENKIEFAGFILKNIKALKKMVVICGRNTGSVCHNFELLFKITEKLTALPRASTRATLEFI